MSKCARSAFSPPHKVVYSSSEPSMAKQSMKAECDVNGIMARFQRTGVVDHLALHGGYYGEVSSSTFHEAMEIVRKAEQMFADLPSSARKRFGNDPAAFMDFIHDPGNIEEMCKMGLAKRVALPVAPSADLPEGSEGESSPPSKAATPPPTQSAT